MINMKNRLVVLLWAMLLLTTSNTLLFGQNPEFKFKPENVIQKVSEKEISKDLKVYTFEFNVQQLSNQVEITWQAPSNDMHFCWTSSGGDGIHPDWSSDLVNSYATSQAPVFSIVNNANQNRLTVAASDGLNRILLSSGVREENGFMVNKVTIFPQAFKGLETFKLKLRFDQRNIPYWQSLEDVSGWWASLENYQPMNIPNEARMPMYSTWYSFHQNLDVPEVISESRLSHSMGCETIIVDDGWQTLDDNRGYKFTGDWKPERIPNIKALADSLHAFGMKLMLWYSVPFVGAQSETYKKFEGKFLDGDQKRDWYTFDPRYPEVRKYLIDTYVKALTDWDLDGFKLDFVDSFSDRGGAKKNGMDYENVNMASDRLFTDVSKALTVINKTILIEFRQSYIGPLMRKYGNMFRAGDCPYSAHNNRVRTANIRLICGNTAAHSDMLMWHPNEPVETAALQLLNVMFSVPQISVKMHQLSKEDTEMLRFWLSFWVANRDALLDGKFEAWFPNLNYPLLIGKTNNKLVAGVYASNTVVPVANSKGNSFQEINVINATGQKEIHLISGLFPVHYNCMVFNYKGEVVKKSKVKLTGLVTFEVPRAGLLKLAAK